MSPQMDRHQWVEQDQDAEHHPHPAHRVLLVCGQRQEGSADADHQAQEEEAPAPVAAEGQEEQGSGDQRGEIQARSAHRHLMVCEGHELQGPPWPVGAWCGRISRLSLPTTRPCPPAPASRQRGAGLSRLPRPLLHPRDLVQYPLLRQDILPLQHGPERGRGLMSAPCARNPGRIAHDARQRGTRVSSASAAEYPM